MKRLLFLVTFLLVSVSPWSVNAQGNGGDRRPITPENAAQVVELTRLGYGTHDAFAWSWDQKTLAVGGSLGVWLYDGDDLAAEPRFLPGSPPFVHHLAYSPDGLWLAVASGRNNTGEDHRLALVDAVTGEPQLVLEEQVIGQPGIAFSQDGSLLAMQTDEAVVLWDVAAGGARFTWPRAPSSVRSSRRSASCSRSAPPSTTQRSVSGRRESAPVRR